MKRLHIKNKRRHSALQFALVLLVLLVVEIVILINIATLKPSVYVPLMTLINMSAVYFFWRKNKNNRAQNTPEK
ncbi:hypothetical protein ES676_10940 [Bizionia saleffrena]|uniref:Uncharacterized protein n=1 Tax=Bizionia saleffrena TaxID=291189 RepID=A0A8H2LG77_9FLAO|nr:hypothetical protein [Bizionia saleffrena]TYB72680.1 hypothetical protein ES676_10940 [Bizionia saleffrena]